MALKPSWSNSSEQGIPHGPFNVCVRVLWFVFVMLCYARQGDESQRLGDQACLSFGGCPQTAQRGKTLPSLLGNRLEL